VSTWIDYVKEHRGEEVIIFIVGNKIDLSEERAVTTEETEEKFKNIGAHFIEVSAKTGENL
jgi:Ras-related protein Rab-6A